MSGARRKVLRNKDGLTEEEFLAQYNPGDYKRPAVTADIVAIGMNEDYTGLKLLLVKRGNHPCMGCWALPGGFAEEDETLYQAAGRELEEETGLTDLYLQQVYTFSKPGRDPRTWVISTAFLALISDLQEVKGMDDAADAAWFDLAFNKDDIIISNEEKKVSIIYSLREETFVNGPIMYKGSVPALASDDALAFDHVEIVIEAVKRLREEMMGRPQAFALVQQEFTLPELQAAYEAVLGHSLYKKSFRDMISSRVEETGGERQSKTRNGRKSKLYRAKYDICDIY